MSFLGIKVEGILEDRRDNNMLVNYMSLLHETV